MGPDEATPASFTTLCAAPYERFPGEAQSGFATYPQEHQHAGQELGFGGVIFDSYMDSSISADQALQRGVFGPGFEIKPRSWMRDFAIGFLFRREVGTVLSMFAPATQCRNKGDAGHTRAMDADRRAPNTEKDSHAWGF
jgi:hypothetical protein